MNKSITQEEIWQAKYKLKAYSYLQLSKLEQDLVKAFELIDEWKSIVNDVQFKDCEYIKRGYTDVDPGAGSSWIEYSCSEQDKPVEKWCVPCRAHESMGRHNPDKVRK